jgi:hypothetical protein
VLTPAAIYHNVVSKEAIIAGMVADVFAEIDLLPVEEH